jgi:hypothetical protein
MISSLSSFFSVVSFGTCYDYFIRIARYFSKYKANKSLMMKVDKLPVINYTDSDETCVICLQKIFLGKKLPCNHLFHIHCLEYSYLSPIEFGL